MKKERENMVKLDCVNVEAEKKSENKTNDVVVRWYEMEKLNEVNQVVCEKRIV
jgi:hypothetical protein